MRILPLGFKDGKINDRQEPAGVALFYEVNDETLDEISVDANYYLDRRIVDKCFREKGRNAHLYLLVSGGSIKDILKNLSFLMEEYDSVSWWTVGHKKFYIRRKRCLA